MAFHTCPWNSRGSAFQQTSPFLDRCIFPATGSSRDQLGIGVGFGSCSFGFPEVSTTPAPSSHLPTTAAQLENRRFVTFAASRFAPSPQWGCFTEGDRWHRPKLDPISAVPALRGDSSLTSNSSDNSCFAHPASLFFHATASGSRVGGASFYGEIQVLEMPHSTLRSRFQWCLVPY